jgi:threonyl-tRNA synthetase
VKLAVTLFLYMLSACCRYKRLPFTSAPTRYLANSHRPNHRPAFFNHHITSARTFTAFYPAACNHTMEAVKGAVDGVKDAVEGVKNMAVSEAQLQQSQQKKQQKKDKKKGAQEDGDARPLEMTPPPSYIDERNKIFDRVKAEYDAWVAEQPRDDINITMPDGSVRVGKAWETSPAEITRGISKSLFERTVISKVDGELWDMDRVLEKSCKLELLDFEHPEGKKVFWHSSAHVLGEACERRFGCSLCIGPPVDDGFYYEMALPNQEPVLESDWKPLEKVAEKAIKEKQTFERLTLKKEDLLEMFKYNKYKQHIIQDKIPDGTSTTVYRCGPLIDLCRGPHIPHTGRIKAFQIMKVCRPAS